jgi:hypothetical protein
LLEANTLAYFVPSSVAKEKQVSQQFDTDAEIIKFEVTIFELAD